jgi:hypothetical protein
LSDTARRFSLMTQAKASSAKTPNADWSCGIDPPPHYAEAGAGSNAQF